MHVCTTSTLTIRISNLARGSKRGRRANALSQSFYYDLIKCYVGNFNSGFIRDILYALSPAYEVCPWIYSFRLSVRSFVRPCVSACVIRPDKC